MKQKQSIDLTQSKETIIQQIKQSKTNELSEIFPKKLYLTNKEGSLNPTIYTKYNITTIIAVCPETIQYPISECITIHKVPLIENYSFALETYLEELRSAAIPVRWTG